MTKVPNLEDYTIVLFSPLVIEQQAVCSMLDEVHDGIPARSVGQTVLYTFGKIASHYVAIAGYPIGEVGIGLSGSMVSEALRDFPNLEFGVLVGIAAGIPSPNRDIRLGDVAVATPNRDNPGVIGYDLIKFEEDEIRLKQWQNSTHALLRSAISSIQVHESRPGPSFTRHLLSIGAKFGRLGPLPPSSEFLCSNSRDEPIAHYGTILSGNGVIKSKKRRDELREKYDGVAIEMEAAGMTTKLPVAVVRGISDFADPSKNDAWHPFAAATAAAYAKEMLIRLGPRKEIRSASQSLISSNIHASLTLALPEKCKFVGRETELKRLENLVGICPNLQTRQRSIVTVLGLTGIGKSQLVSEFVKQQRQRYTGYDVFWIAGATKEAFEQSIVDVLKVADEPEALILDGGKNYDEHRRMLIKLFFSELNTEQSKEWLLVIDGIPGDASLQQYIRSYLDTLLCGSIVLTTRSRELANWYPERIELKGLSEANAVNLLHREIDESLRPSEGSLSIPFAWTSNSGIIGLMKHLGVLDLAKMLNCHPLSLRLATSVISYHGLSVRQYVEKWRMRQLHDEHHTNMALSRSLELSFEELEMTNSAAAKLLMLFAYLDHRDLWMDLCINATDDDLPEWLRQMASSKSLHGHYLSMRNLSFVDAKRHGRRQDQIYEIHPAIHEFARWKAKDNEEEYVKAAVSLIAAKVPRFTDKNFLEIVQRLEPHADQCMIHLKQGRSGVGLDLLELEQFGNLFRHLGRYDESSRLYVSILNILNAENAPDGSTREMMGGIENNLGLVYHARRQYHLALQAYERSNRKRLLCEPHDEDALVTTEYNKGRALIMLGKLDEALKIMLKAATHFSRLMTSRGFSNNDHSDGNEAAGQTYLRILNDAGEILLRKNNLKQAEHNFRTAFDGYKSLLQEMHPMAFAVRLNIGRVCVERPQFATANRIFEYIIAAYTEWWGRRHPETMRVLAELADSNMRHAELKTLVGDGGDRELTMAKDRWTEVLSFQQEIFGPNSDAATFARSELQRLQLLCSVDSEDPYILYYS